MAKTSATKGREILSAKNKYPEFNQMDYDRSMRENLFFYNLEVDDLKKKKEWAIAYWKSQGKNVVGFAKFSDGYFATVGAVAHMAHVRNIDLSPLHYGYLDKKYQDFSSVIVEEVEEKSDLAAIEKAKADAELAIFKTHMAEFDYGLDMFFEGKVFDAKSYLIRNNVKVATTKQIATELKPVLQEVKDAISCKDEQLVEAYSHLTKRQLNKYADYIQGLIDSCEVATAIAKASRKPRVTKVKSPTEIAKNAKYMLEDKTSGIKSEHPSKIVKSTEVWIYNAKNRRLFKYVPLTGFTLSIKGTTIINVDAEKSGGKIIRKPEVTLKDIQTLTSRPLNALYKSIRGTESKALGRLNEDSLIVKCI